MRPPSRNSNKFLSKKCSLIRVIISTFISLSLLNEAIENPEFVNNLPHMLLDNEIISNFKDNSKAVVAVEKFVLPMDEPPVYWIKDIDYEEILI